MKSFSRADRVAEEIRKLIAGHWDAEMADRTPGMITFTQVRLSKDLRYATVYFSFLGEEDQRDKVIEFLGSRRKQIRLAVGKQLRVRHIPELTFKYDPSVQEGLRIEQLLNEIKRDKEE